MILKNYALLDFGGQPQQTHFRESRSGCATTLVLLHPSPLSSAFMAPLIELFEGQVDVLAPDTPGYGASDPLPEPPQDLSAYVDWLKRFLQSQGLGRAAIFVLQYFDAFIFEPILFGSIGIIGYAGQVSFTGIGFPVDAVF